MQNVIDQTSIKYWNFFKELMLHNFMEYFSDTEV